MTSVLLCTNTAAHLFRIFLKAFCLYDCLEKYSLLDAVCFRRCHGKVQGLLAIWYT